MHRAAVRGAAERARARAAVVSGAMATITVRKGAWGGGGSGWVWIDVDDDELFSRKLERPGGSYEIRVPEKTGLANWNRSASDWAAGLGQVGPLSHPVRPEADATIEAHSKGLG
jgi:hypothetical protein